MLAADATAALLDYSWPGNVRELSNLMERLTLPGDTPVVTAAMLDIPGAPSELLKHYRATTTTARHRIRCLA
jgi:DNA-binding NtrC family response regulator